MLMPQGRQGHVVTSTELGKYPRAGEREAKGRLGSMLRLENQIRHGFTRLVL